VIERRIDTTKDSLARLTGGATRLSHST
jgi:hypothetical protein